MKALVLVALLVSGCAVPVGRSPYVPTFPPKPVLTARPIIQECSAGGQTQECVTMLRRDWETIARWGLEWEREARALCLAIGRTPQECGTDR
jgi:hypothetical protein